MFEYDPNQEKQRQNDSLEATGDPGREYDQAWSSTVPPLYDEPQKKRGGFLKTAGLCLLVTALAFGSGFAGAKLAYRQPERVVIKEVGEGSGGDKLDGGQNTSGVQGSQAVAEKAVPSVVAIRTEAMVTGNFWFGSQVTSGAGSGVIIS